MKQYYLEFGKNNMTMAIIIGDKKSCRFTQTYVGTKILDDCKYLGTLDTNDILAAEKVFNILIERTE
jgi:O-phosphoseryl-tRNA(Cys) synthetase